LERWILMQTCSKLTRERERELQKQSANGVESLLKIELTFAETNLLHDFPPSWRHKILNRIGRVQLIAITCKQFKWHLMIQSGSAFETSVHKTCCQGIKDDAHCDYIHTYHIDASKLSSVQTNQLKVGSSTSHE
jgi:hypothetical protein